MLLMMLRDWSSCPFLGAIRRLWESGLLCSLRLSVAYSVTLVPSRSSVVAIAGPGVHICILLPHPGTLPTTPLENPSIDTLPSQKASSICSCFPLPVCPLLLFSGCYLLQVPRVARDSSPPDYQAPGPVLGCATVTPAHGLPHSRGAGKGVKALGVGIHAHRPCYPSCRKLVV